MTFSDFEDQVQRDQSKAAAVADGTVHPLCAHVTSFIKRLFTYPNAGQVLFGDAATSRWARRLRGGCAAAARRLRGGCAAAASSCAAAGG